MSDDWLEFPPYPAATWLWELTEDETCFASAFAVPDDRLSVVDWYRQRLEGAEMQAKLGTDGQTVYSLVLPGAVTRIVTFWPIELYTLGATPPGTQTVIIAEVPQNVTSE